MVGDTGGLLLLVPLYKTPHKRRRSAALVKASGPETPRGEAWEQGCCGSELQVFGAEALCQSSPFMFPFLLLVMRRAQALIGLLMPRKFGFIFLVSITWLCH